MPSPLTITIHVAEAVRPAVEGRRQLSLGVPSSASLGDLLETLFKLYPRLSGLLASDRRAGPQGLRVVVGGRSTRDVLARSAALQHGQRLYLTAVPVRKPSVPRG